MHFLWLGMEYWTGTNHWDLHFWCVAIGYQPHVFMRGVGSVIFSH